MSIKTSKENLPKEILEKAVKLRNAVRQIFIVLYCFGEPKSAEDIAKSVGHARAYVNMRLNQLEDMGLVKSHKEGKTKFFEVIK